MPPTPERNADDLKPGQVIGKCRVEKELGRGGMGAVYLARHTTLDVPVALKVLPARFAKDDPAYADRFLREARMAARLKHPNVIAVMDADRDETTGLYYIVEEYVEGGSVSGRVGRTGLPEAKAVAIVSSVLRALQAAAREGIVHRDIKPDNILISKDGRVKLADLGLAKRTGESEAGITQSATAIGTPHYMSPEQIKDSKHVDTRSDIYSLGATMYQLLTGMPPFPGTQVFAVLHKVMNDPTPDPRQRKAEVSEGTARVCMRMMAREVEDRYQTPTEVLADLAKGGPGLELEPAPEPLRTAAPSVYVPSQGQVDLTVPATLTAPPNTGAMQKLAWVVAGCCVLLVAFAAKMMLKSHEPLADAPSKPPATDTGDMPGPDRPPDSTRPDPKNPDPTQPKPPVDPPPVEKPFPLANGCVLALSFEPETQMEQEGHSGYRDISGQRILAIVNGAASVEGRVGQGLRFNGTSDYISLPPAAQRTVAAWVRADEQRQMVWYDGGSDTRLQGFLLGIARPGNFGWPLQTDGVFVGFWQVDALFPVEAIASGWHHIVASWDGDRVLRVAVDGAFPDGFVFDRRAGGRPQPAAQPLALAETPAPKTDFLVVGRSKINGNPGLAAFHGILDELAVWDRALTEAEMKELYGFAGRRESYCEEVERHVKNR